MSLVLPGCAITKSPAPIVYNHKNSSLPDSNSNNDGLIPLIDSDGATTEITPDDKNYILPEQSPSSTSRKTIYHEVQPEESIEDIAIKYEQSVEEIGRLNSLFPPYEVEPYQSLKISVASSFMVENNIPKRKGYEETIDELDREFINPVEGKLISQFGKKTVYGTNKGINIAAKAGTKVQASASGKIIYADYDSTFGNLVIVKVENKNVVTAYAHLEDLIVNKGDKIKQGDVLGNVGNTGKVRENQLHFAVREGKKSVNPLKYVNYSGSH